MSLYAALLLALCDLIGYLDELSDPIVVGGRYSKERLIQAFYSWCQDRNINVKDADGIGWLNACRSGSLTTDDGPTKPPEKPKPPVAPSLPPTSVEPEDTVPEEGFYQGDSWKPPEERKKRWTEEGEIGRKITMMMNRSLPKFTEEYYASTK